MMNAYQKEQFETLYAVGKLISQLPAREADKLGAMISDYLAFRAETAGFLKRHFGEICTSKCYLSRLSACCSREGIITFFADIIINVLMSEPDSVIAMLEALKIPNKGYKCVYLGNQGCMWKIKPIVCEMFVCDSAKQQVFGSNPVLEKEWEALKQREKGFTWPDRPVLFDMLEDYFLDAGCSSPLMYLHNSPGLLRIKQKALEDQCRETEASEA